jgi:signal transduction histidine kinase
MPVEPTTSPSGGIPTTRLLSVAAVALAVVTLFGEGAPSPGTVVGVVVGLVPWVLAACGVRLPPALFAAMVAIPAIAIVTIEGNPGGMFPLMLLVVWVGRESPRWPLVAATVVASVGALGVLAIRESPDDAGLVYFCGGLAISWLTGLLLRRQEALTAEVAAMRDVQVAALAAEERARIAREVHDVVAHSLTIVMLNVTGARRALATQPARADEALARAEVVGRDSLASIRQVMGLLREPASGTVDGEASLARVPDLVARSRAAGLDVELAMDTASTADPAVDLVAYRIVQESLANVLQHAPGASARVDIAHDGERLSIAVTNGRPSGPPPPRADRTGLGTRGMVERVRALGGTLDTGPTPSGGWRVAAEIPDGGHAVNAPGPTWLTTSAPPTP